jgi:formylglycine-generating enzyme required for sulfatase activity/Tol biopolymer transport system component
MEALAIMARNSVQDEASCPEREREISGLLRKAIVLGLSKDDESLARIFLSGHEVDSLGNDYWEHPAFPCLLEDMEAAVAMDRNGQLGVLAEYRFMLARWDACYCLMALRIKDQTGAHAAIKYLEGKVDQYEYLSTNPLLLVMGQLSKFCREIDDVHRATYWLEKLISAEPVNPNSEEEQALREETKRELDSLNCVSEPTLGEKTGRPCTASGTTRTYGEAFSSSGNGSIIHDIQPVKGSGPSSLPKILTLGLGTRGGLGGTFGARLELDLLLIPAGTFVMGSPPEEEGRSDQERPLDVTISKPFYMGKFPVTQVQYEKIMGLNLSDTKGPNNPADRVSWNDASEFCRRLSTLTGRTVRLPTMAEWEYACRAGAATRFFTGNSASDLARAGWYKDNSNGTTHPVGQKAPNRWGIYDMHGNVYEWCLDVWGGADCQSSEPVTDPVGLEQVDAYSVRGGCWGSDVNDCRSAGGMECESGVRNNSIGFRVVVDPWGRKYSSAETVSSEGDFAAKEQGNYGKARETVTMQSPLSPAEEETIAACAQERNGLIRKIIVNLLFLIPYLIVMFSSSGGGQPSKGAMWMLLPILIWGFIGFRWVLNAFTSVTGLVLFANLKSWGWMFFFGSVICSMFGGLIIPILIVLQSIKLYRFRGNSKAIGRLAIALPVAFVAAVIIIPFVMHLTSQNRQGMTGRAVVGIPSETKTGESSGSRNAAANRGIPVVPQSSPKTTRPGYRAHNGSREKVENRRPQIEPPVTPPRLAETTASAKASPVAESRSLTDPRASSGLIAFVARNGKKREIYTMRPDGSCQSSLSSQLQDAFASVWSPDGTQILFCGGEAGDFYVAASDGSNTRKVLDIAQVAPDFPGVQPFQLNADGRWLPDGKTIAVCAGSWPDASHIYLVELPDLKRSTMPITGAAWQPAWSPDGRRIAFLTFSQVAEKAQRFQIWLLDVKTLNQEPISRECDIQAGPLWLPDGKRIIFIEHGGWSNGRRNNKLCMKNVENGEYTETDFSWDVAQIVVSPDGQNIAFSPRGSPIYVFQLVGNDWQQKAVIDNGGYPTWSPDGTSLAFVSSVDRQIWLVHADGTGLVRIRPTSGPDSPSGTDTSGQPDSFDIAKERPEWSPINRTYASSGPSRPKLPSNFPKLEKPLADGLHVDYFRLRDGASIKHQVTLPTKSARRNASDSNSDTSAIPTDETREKRTWAFKSRPPITASLVSESLGVVVLRKEDGSTSRFTEKYLSDADQVYVQGLRNEVSGKAAGNEGQ